MNQGPLSKASIDIIGAGPMGHAYQTRLTACGYTTHVRQPDTGKGTMCTYGLIALRHGDDVQKYLQSLGLARGSVTWIDMTTQTALSSEACHRLCKERRMRYHGGGVLGGASQAQQGKITILLGPPVHNKQATAILGALGSVKYLPSAAAAAEAKLLHNFVLIVQNLAIGRALKLSVRVPVRDLLDIFDAGNAGRPPSLSSAARDFCTSPISSYSGSLAAKDLAAMQRAFPSLEATPGLDLAALTRFYTGLGDRPYTCEA